MVRATADSDYADRDRQGDGEPQPVLACQQEFLAGSERGVKQGHRKDAAPGPVVQASDQQPDADGDQGQGGDIRQRGHQAAGGIDGKWHVDGGEEDRRDETPLVAPQRVMARLWK